MGIDWGGGAGGTVRRVRGRLVIEGGSASFTVVTICGWRPGSVLPQLIYAERLPSNLNPYEEVKKIFELFQAFRCYRVGHDFGGSGNLREVMMLQAGFPAGKIFPCLYIPASSKNMVTHVPHGPHNPRTYYTVDKARSLSMLCQLIKSKDGVFFPQWESIRDIGEEFLHLVEDKRERPNGADVLLITRDPSKNDDFCHSLNYACICHWHSCQRYPDLAEQFRIGLTEDQMKALYPDNYGPIDWNAQ
jgi:hypothetical protein